MKKTITQTLSALMSLAMISVVFFGCGPKEEPLPPTPPAPTTVSVTGVSLNKTSLSLVEGGSESLTATVSPDNATNKVKPPHALSQ